MQSFFDLTGAPLHADTDPLRDYLLALPDADVAAIVEHSHALYAQVVETMRLYSDAHPGMGKIPCVHAARALYAAMMEITFPDDSDA